MVSIASRLTTKNIPSPIMWQLKKNSVVMFVNLGRLIDNGLISTIDLVMEFGLPHNKM
jgi:hypothetical protein